MYHAEVPKPNYFLTNPLLWLAVFMGGVGFVATFFLAQGLDMSELIAVIVGVVVALVSLLIVHLSASRLCDGFVGARPADPVKHAALFNAVETICLASGLRQPELKVFDDNAPAALAYGTTLPRICVSPAFFDSFSTTEQEAVAAHLLCRVESGDARRDTQAAVIYGAVMGLVGGRSFLSAHIAAKQKKQTLLYVDLAAAKLSKYPPALMSALEIMKNGEAAKPGQNANTKQTTKPEQTKQTRQTMPDLPRWLTHMLMLPPGEADFNYRMGVLAEI